MAKLSFVATDPNIVSEDQSPEARGVKKHRNRPPFVELFE